MSCNFVFLDLLLLVWSDCQNGCVGIAGWRADSADGLIRTANRLGFLLLIAVFGGGFAVLTNQRWTTTTAA
jgi:hypothetical protein